jgi:hypothetical protein
MRIPADKLLSPRPLVLADLFRMIMLWSLLFVAARSYYHDLDVFSPYRQVILILTLYVAWETSRCITASRLCSAHTHGAIRFWSIMGIVFGCFGCYFLWMRSRALYLWAYDSSYPRQWPYPDRLIEFCFLFVSGASSRDCGMSSHWHGWVISISEILVGTSILLLVVSLGQFFACVLRRGAENGSKGSDQKR